MSSRTLTAVYDALLEDIVYPVEIVGKRIRVKLDGSQLIKVHLDKNEQTNIEHKVYLPILSLSLYAENIIYVSCCLITHNYVLIYFLTG